MAAEGPDGSARRLLRRIHPREGRLIVRARARARVAGLLAGSALILLWAGALAAQVPTPPAPPPPEPQAPPPPGVLPVPPDTIPGDTTKPDTTKTKPDSILSPFAQAVLPQLLEPGEAYHWDRAALFNTGALTLEQVFERVPGLTVFISGWITTPQYASYLGNPARLRVFVDGVELIPLGNGRSYPLDLSTVQIWNVEEMTLERGVDEARLYIRTWSVTHTHMQSRVDIVTGDLGTNLLRGFWGKRWLSGFGFQFGGQIYGTAQDLYNGSGNGNDLMIRFGWARGPWSFDLYAQRGNGTRDVQACLPFQNVCLPELSPAIPSQVFNQSLGYLRAGYGQVDSSRVWAQATLEQEIVNEQSKLSTLYPTYVPSDSLRVQQRATQAILAAGLNAGPLKLSVSDRYRWLPFGSDDEFIARMSLGGKFLSLTGYLDYVPDSSKQIEGALTITPTSYLMLQGAVGYRSADSAAGGSGISGRLAVGARLGRVWLQGGAVQRDATVVPGLVGYDTLYVSAQSRSNTGFFFSVNGKAVEDVGLNFYVVRWQQPGWYLPQLQERGDVYLDTQWLSRFPSGHFGLHASFGEEYRSDVMFPTAGIPEAFSDSTIVAIHSVVLFTNIQVRVLDATLYFTANWALTPRPYLLVPQFLQPVQIYTYGLRWAFWN